MNEIARALAPCALAAIAAAVLPHRLAAQRSAVEIRTYNLRAGVRDEFQRLVIQTLPLLRQYGIDVIAWGPSLHDSTTYYLVRAFPGVAERQRQEDAFYGSDAWRNGPRERVLALIESYTTLVLSLDAGGVASLFAGDGGVARSYAVPGEAEAREAVERLNREYIEAARTGDHAWFAANLAAGFVVIQGSGRRLTRDEFVAAVRDGPNTTRSLTVRGVTMRVFGTTVQVDADAPWERMDGSRGVSRYIDTWAWLDCRWQAVSAQITLLPP